tara:strand:- start:84 stop:584 length:501 start_codon:yes stop_codon:yes gene_type:complete
MPRQTPLAVRTHAFELYSTGMSVPDIVLGLRQEFPDEPVSAPTIYSWKRRYDWETRKGRVEEKALAKVEETQIGVLARTTKEHQEAYARIRNKAMGELENLTFQRPIDAVKAADIGIQGERAAIQGMVNLSFITAVAEIVSEEVHDEATLARLSARFSSLVDSVDG